MGFHLIGTGLAGARSLTLEAMDVLKSADKIYLEQYTSIPGAPLSDFEQLLGKEVIPLTRDMIEEKAEDFLIKPAETHEIAVLIPGDPLAATTHHILLRECRHRGIETSLLQNASIFTAVARTGLSLYKFGRAITIPYPDERGLITSTYEQLKENVDAGLHTLILFDLDPGSERFMTVSQAITQLRACEASMKLNIFKEETSILAVAALGRPEETILCGTPSDLENIEIEAYPRCLILPGRLGHDEEEAIQEWRVIE